MSVKTFENVQAHIVVSYKESTYGAEYEPISITNHNLEMTAKKPCQITVKNGLTIPGMYGQYSSHQVHVEITIPATQKEVDEQIVEICDKYLHLTHPYLQGSINQICLAQGKQEFFKDAPEEPKALPEVKL